MIAVSSTSTVPVGALRSSSPDQIAGLTLWLDNDTLSGVDGDPVSAWSNSGSLGGSADAAGSARPILKTGTPNGRPVLYFDGVDDAMATASGAWVTTSGWTCIVVAQSINDAANDGHMVDSDTNVGSGRVAQFMKCEDGYPAAVGFDSTGTAHTPGPDTFDARAYGVRVFVAAFDSDSLDMFLSDQISTTPTGGGVTPRATAQPIRIGSRSDGNNFFHGSIYEVALWSRKLTSSERSTAVAYMERKFARSPRRSVGRDYSQTQVAFAENIRGNVVGTLPSGGMSLPPFTTALWTSGTTQYVAYVDAALNLKVTSRSHGAAAWSAPANVATANSDDDHFPASIGVDSNGDIHWSGAIHASPMSYRRSATAGDPSSIGVATLIGTEETSTSYPEFFEADGNLFFFYREGGTNDGNWYLNAYDAGTETWSRVCELMTGAGGNYPFTVGVSPVDESIHIAWIGRAAGAETATDMWYATTTDGGANWVDARGNAMTLPIARSNLTNRIMSVPAGKQMINQTGLAVDASGAPHIAFWIQQPNGSLELCHGIIAGGVLDYHPLTRDVHTGTIGITPGFPDFSRPQVCCFPDGTVWVLFRRPASETLWVADVSGWPNHSLHAAGDGYGGDTPIDRQALKNRGEVWILQPTERATNAAAAMCRITAA